MTTENNRRLNILVVNLSIYIYRIIYNNKSKDYNPKVTYNNFYRHTFHNKDIVKGK